MMSVPMDALSSACLEKLETFRIKELKDVLTRIGAPKQGKRQALIEKVMRFVSAPERQPVGFKGSRPESSTKFTLSREEVAKIIDDVYRKMRGSSALDLATAGDILAGLKSSAQSNKRVETVTRCPCGSKLSSESIIQCDGPKCMVWQHVNCVLIPEKEDLKPEQPSQFYCELCRIQFGDPYCVAIAHPMPPVKMITTSFSASESSKPLQNVEKSFLVTRSNQEMLLKPQFDIQVWSLLLNDKVTFRMHWPLNMELRINGYSVRAISRPSHQPLGINGRDDGVGISDYVREGSNSIFMSAGDGRPFCVGVRIIQRISVEQILNRIPRESDGESFDTALARVRRCIGGGNGQVDNANDSDSDLEVMSECVFINLRCPMSGSRMKVAGRFKRCIHMGCFDLHTLVESNQMTRKWQCPICLTNYSLDELIIDPFLTRIVTAMKSYGEDVCEVEMKPDGHWRPKLEGEARIQEAWRSPEGMLVTAPANNQIEMKPVKIEEGLPPADKVPLKIGLKRARDGTWQVTQSNGAFGMLKNGNGASDPHRMFPSADFSRSSSMTVNTAEVLSARREGILHPSRAADIEVNSVPTGAPLNLDQQVASGTADSDSRRNEEVIILSDTEEENVPECHLENDITTRSMMIQAEGALNRGERVEKDLDTNITFLDVEPLQESAVDFFDSNRAESVHQDSWLSQIQDPPFELMGSAQVFPKKVSGHQRPRSNLTQTSRRASNGFGHDQHRRNGMSESRIIGRDGLHHDEEDMVDTYWDSASTDQSLRLFLPPQPAKSVAPRRINDANPVSDDGLRDAWFSLSLGNSERMAESRPTRRASPFSSEEASQERLGSAPDQSSGLLNLSSQATSSGLERSFTQRRSAGITMHRSAHRPRSYFRVDSDSDD